MKSQFDLKSETQAVVEEILRYKWLESEKSGHDIGMSRAAKEWISRHYDLWFRENYQGYQKQ